MGWGGGACAYVMTLIQSERAEGEVQGGGVAYYTAPPRCSRLPGSVNLCSIAVRSWEPREPMQEEVSIGNMTCEVA